MVLRSLHQCRYSRLRGSPGIYFSVNCLASVFGQQRSMEFHEPQTYVAQLQMNFKHEFVREQFILKIHGPNMGANIITWINKRIFFQLLIDVRICIRNTGIVGKCHPTFQLYSNDFKSFLSISYFTVQIYICRLTTRFSPLHQLVIFYSNFLHYTLYIFY